MVSSDYKEDMTLKLPPKELAEVLSMGKAEAVAKKYKDAIVIGADSFIAFTAMFSGSRILPRARKRCLRDSAVR